MWLLIATHACYGTHTNVVGICSEASMIRKVWHYNNDDTRGWRYYYRRAA
jgi:hypothetical protein